MKTVRQELRGEAAFTHTGPTDSIIDRVECLAWRKFDALKDEGKLKKWGFVDVSDVVELALKLIFGARPPNCL